MTIMKDEDLYVNVELCLKKCLNIPGSVHNLDMDDWPLEMCISAGDVIPESVSDFLKGRMIIVMCSTLGNWSPRVPQFVANQCIVIYVKNHRKTTKYGFRACDFIWGNAATWQDKETAIAPLGRFWKVVKYLYERYHISTRLSFVSVSAGVDQALSLISYKRLCSDLHLFTIHCLTAVAGAHHPTLHENSLPVLLGNDTFVIVLHHTRDRFCGWHEVSPFWRRFQEEASEFKQACVYRVLYSFNQQHLVGPEFHDIGKFLFCQSDFGRYLIIDPDSRKLSAHYFQDASEKGLGTIKVSLDKELLFGYDRVYDMKSHQLAMGLIVLRSSHYARQSSQGQLRSACPNANFCIALARAARTIERRDEDHFVKVLQSKMDPTTGVQVVGLRLYCAMLTNFAE